MISLDTSAIVAIALEEPEEEEFNRLIVLREALVGTPTLVECRLVLSRKIPAFAEAFLDGFARPPYVHPVAFTLEMYRLASAAFDRFGRGRHAAKLNFGDCLAYAVAVKHETSLLYKGEDFSLTDIRPALP